MFKKFQKWFAAEKEEKPVTDDSVDLIKPKETSTPLEHKTTQVVTRVPVPVKKVSKITTLDSKPATVITRVLPGLVNTTTRMTQTPQRSKVHTRCEFKFSHVFQLHKGI